MSLESEAESESVLKDMMDDWDRQIASLGDNRRTRLESEGDESMLSAFLRRLKGVKHNKATKPGSCMLPVCRAHGGCDNTILFEWWL